MKIPTTAKNQYEALGDETLNTLQAQLGNLKILIIDEISMISRKVLSYIHGRLRQIKQIKSTNRTAFFGNVSILAVGDFYQLPPVNAKPLVEKNSQDGLDIWHDNFKIVSLDEIMHQKDDANFAKLLNRLREKSKTEQLSEKDNAALQSRANAVKGLKPHCSKETLLLSKVSC